jgi:hypothetical protein
MPDFHLAWGAPGSETYLVHKQCNLCGNWWQSKCTYHLNGHTNPHTFYYYALKMQRVQCTCYGLSLWSMCLAFLMSLQLQFLWSHVDLGFCTFIQYLTFSNVSSSPTDHKLCCVVIVQVIGECHRRWHLWRRNYDVYLGYHHLLLTDVLLWCSNYAAICCLFCKV